MEKIKRYWVRNLVDDREYVTNARNIQHLAEKLGIAKGKIEICKVYRRDNLDANDLILLH